MCSYSHPGHVHVSEKTHALLKHKFGATSRGKSEIKGKGSMQTYFLVNTPPEGGTGRESDAGILTVQLPSPPTM
jgi:class 3 adenylate cyclase